jgi:hypothetical protein
MEFLRLLAHDFENFEFDVISSFSMETPPPSSIITMPVVSAGLPNLEIIFKKSWVLEPNYTVSVKWGLPEPLSISTVMFWSTLERIDPQNKWLLRDFPSDQLYERYYKGSPAFSGSVRNQHLLYALFHILYFEAGQAGTRISEAESSKAKSMNLNPVLSLKEQYGPKSQAWQEQQSPHTVRFCYDDGACWGIPFHQVLGTHYNPKHESLLIQFALGTICRDRPQNVGFLRPILRPQGHVA